MVIKFPIGFTGVRVSKQKIMIESEEKEEFSGEPRL